MLTIDAQVHAYERNHPGRPWAGVLHGPPEVTGDDMVAAMDAVGVDGALLVSPFSMYRYDASYAIDVHAAHPGRFALIKPVDPSDPGVTDTIDEWAARDGTVAIRIMMRATCRPTPPIPASTASWRPPRSTACRSISCAGGGWSRPAAGGAQPQHHAGDRPSRAAAAIRAAGAGAALRRSAEAAEARRARQHRGQDHRCLHALARAVPLQGHLGSARPHLRRVRLRSLHVGNRLDARRGSADYKEGVEAFRVTDRLSDSDRAKLMGGTLQRVYGWAPGKIL